MGQRDTVFDGAIVMSIRHLGSVLLAPCIAIATAATSATPQRSAPALVYPSASWERITNPDSAGWARRELDSARARLSRLTTTGFMAVVDGRVLLEYGDVRAVSYLAAARNSVLSMLFGSYVANGSIGLDKTLAQIGIDDRGGLTPQEREATIRDLLTSRSGVYHPASIRGGDDLAGNAPPRGSQKHGTLLLYSNWDFNALGTIFERETGRKVYDALESDLARPLGMEDFDRAAQRTAGDTTRSEHPAYHMSLSTRDMARVGLLMLREGSWNGRQVIPRDWVALTTRAVTPLSEMNPPYHRGSLFGFGYLWWVWDGPAATGPYRGAYTASGDMGQYITVLPAMNMVFAHKTRPDAARETSLFAYLAVVDLVVRARCHARPQGIEDWCAEREAAVRVLENPVSLTAAERAVYVGTWAFTISGWGTLVVHVAEENRRLMAWAEGKPHLPLIPLGNHVFGSTGDEKFRLKFTVDGGRITRVTLEETNLSPVEGVRRP